MPSDAEIEKTIARSQELDKLWEETEAKLAEFELEKQAFSREVGIEFEEYLANCAQQAADAASQLDDESRQKLDEQRKSIQEEFEQELAAAKSQRDAGRLLQRSTGKHRSRRLRNMV